MPLLDQLKARKKKRDKEAEAQASATSAEADAATEADAAAPARGGLADALKARRATKAVEAEKASDAYAPNPAMMALVGYVPNKASRTQLGFQSETPTAGPKDWEAYGRGGAQGVTLNFADEATGAAYAPFTKRVDESLFDAYRREQQDSERAYLAAQERSPGDYLAGELTGGLMGPGFGTGSFAARGATTASKALRAGTGAAALSVPATIGEAPGGTFPTTEEIGIRAGLAGTVGTAVGAVGAKIGQKLASRADDATKFAQEATEIGELAKADQIRPQLEKAAKEEAQAQYAINKSMTRAQKKAAKAEAKAINENAKRAYDQAVRESQEEAAFEAGRQQIAKTPKISELGLDDASTVSGMGGPAKALARVEELSTAAEGRYAREFKELPALADDMASSPRVDHFDRLLDKSGNELATLRGDLSAETKAVLKQGSVDKVIDDALADFSTEVRDSVKGQVAGLFRKAGAEADEPVKLFDASGKVMNLAPEGEVTAKQLRELIEMAQRRAKYGAPGSAVSMADEGKDAWRAVRHGLAQEELGLMRKWRPEKAPAYEKELANYGHLSDFHRGAEKTALRRIRSPLESDIRRPAVKVEPRAVAKPGPVEPREVPEAVRPLPREIPEPRFSGGDERYVDAVERLAALGPRKSRTSAASMIGEALGAYTGFSLGGTKGYVTGRLGSKFGRELGQSVGGGGAGDLAGALGKRWALATKNTTLAKHIQRADDLGKSARAVLERYGPIMEKALTHGPKAIAAVERALMDDPEYVRLTQ